MYNLVIIYRVRGRTIQSNAEPVRITQSRPEVQATHVITVIEGWMDEVNMLRDLNSYR